MNSLRTPFRIAYSKAPDQPTLKLEFGRHFRLYPVRLQRDVGRILPARLIDLARLGMAVHVVDGLLGRSGSLAGFRSPYLEVEVLDLEFWKEQTVGTALKTCLDFVSGGDDWHVRFIPDRITRHEHQKQIPFVEPTTVCLYSGGLDSAAGMAARLREPSGQCFLPVTVRHQSLRSRLVSEQFDLLRRRYKVEPGRFLPLTVAAYLRNRQLYRDLKVRARGSRHRCRSFLFMALGGMVAAVERGDRVEIYESGVGAVNLPLMGGMTDWKTTRNAHPYFLELMSRLISLVAERQITFTLPFLDRTKASMAAILAQDDLGDLARATMSCILHPLRRGNARQCGVCPACVYRRQALLSAGIEEPPLEYRYDLFGPAHAFRAIPQRQLWYMKAFLVQAAKLEELRPGGIIPRFFRNHLLRTRVVEEERSIAPFIDLFRLYREEWLNLASVGQTRGWPWAHWLAPGKVAV